MDFELSEEQLLLQQSISKVLKDRYDFKQRLGYMSSADGWSREVWAVYADIGLLALYFAEKNAEFGAGAVETMLLAEQMGTVLALEPWLSTVVLAGGLLRRGATETQRKDLFPLIISGKTLLAFAQTEAQSGYELHDVATTATREGSAWILNGKKEIVLHGDSADYVLVSARTSGAQRDRSGIGVFLVPCRARGVSRRGFSTTDGQRAACIILKQVALGPESLMGSAEHGIALIDEVVDETVAALAAEAAGCMQGALSVTVEHLKTRKQFGRTLGSFQVLQHRAAEMLIALEQSRSMAMLAAQMAEHPDAAERRRYMHAVKVEIARNGRFIGQETVQLHGGIGMANEHIAGHYLKRLTAINNTFGNLNYHLSALSASGGIFDSR